MAKKITVIGGSGFVGTNLCRQLALKQQDFEIIDLKMSNQFPEKCKIADVRDAETLRNMITGDVVVNLAAVHRDDVRDKLTFCFNLRHISMPKLTLIEIRSHENLSNGKLPLCAGMMKSTDCNDRRRQATKPNERKPFIEAAQGSLFSDRTGDMCL